MILDTEASPKPLPEAVAAVLGVVEAPPPAINEASTACSDTLTMTDDKTPTLEYGSAGVALVATARRGRIHQL